MKKTFKYIILITFFSLTGCYTSYPRAKYSLGSVKTFSKTTEKKLCKDLRNLFPLDKKFLFEKKPKSKNTLCYFSNHEEVGLKSYALLVGARRDKNQIIVDIQSLNIDINNIRNLVKTMLLKKYPNLKVLYE